MVWWIATSVALVNVGVCLITLDKRQVLARRAAISAWAGVGIASLFESGPTAVAFAVSGFVLSITAQELKRRWHARSVEVDR